MTPIEVIESILEGATKTLPTTATFGHRVGSSGAVLACALGAGRYNKFGVNEVGKIAASICSNEYLYAEDHLGDLYWLKYGNYIPYDNDQRGRNFVLKRLRELKENL